MLSLGRVSEPVSNTAYCKCSFEIAVAFNNEDNSLFHLTLQGDGCKNSIKFRIFHSRIFPRGNPKTCHGTVGGADHNF
jgi:hypothetical protein